MVPSHSRSSPSLFLSLLAVLVSQLPFTSTSCFHPNHFTILSDDYQPCGNGVSSDSVSMCCAINRSPGYDICQKDGLCGNAMIGEDEFWRESCTDRSWSSGSCLKLCIDGVGACFTVLRSPFYSLRIAINPV